MLRAMYIMHKRDGISELADFFDGILEGLDFARTKISEYDKQIDDTEGKIMENKSVNRQIIKEEMIVLQTIKNLKIENAKLFTSNHDLKKENNRLLSRNTKLRLLLHRILDRSGDFKINLSQDINETNKRIYDRINDFRSNLSKDIHEILDN